MSSAACVSSALDNIPGISSEVIHNLGFMLPQPPQDLFDTALQITFFIRPFPGYKLRQHVPKGVGVYPVEGYFYPFLFRRFSLFVGCIYPYDLFRHPILPRVDDKKAPLSAEFPSMTLS
jgi:hypothetical protein